MQNFNNPRIIHYFDEKTQSFREKSTPQTKPNPYTEHRALNPDGSTNWLSFWTYNEICDANGNKLFRRRFTSDSTE
ncbi:hypothetical protein [Candidatus Phytoplasma australiense]|uniref:Uncharacterized protein n=1 Tax=Strawberry lethal yellows phytoplasma (CPA) str. NZSb11 TaxID=980422 RepID=R4RR32_PHYAS|nr:hypothetical protein [Candidatus Phytoplasma australiense]AGL90946.1 Hypothetical Protein SLY_1032 [Strawberry lethal yellows phytoplasma (CPA) str. NZSb11]